MMRRAGMLRWGDFDRACGDILDDVNAGGCGWDEVRWAMWADIDREKNAQIRIQLFNSKKLKFECNGLP